MIKKMKGKYVVLSETTGRKFGSYDTLAEAKKRLRQIDPVRSLCIAEIHPLAIPHYLLLGSFISLHKKFF